MCSSDLDRHHAGPPSTTAAPFPAVRGATVALPYWEPETDTDR